MADFDFHKVAKQVSEVAERIADVSDAARGNATTKRSGGRGRWLILPAAGAVAYAVAKRAPDAGRVVRGATQRASDMPDRDLMNRVKEVAGFGNDGDEQQERQDDGQQNERRTARAADTREVEQHRRERAERRHRRREAMSS